jgi:carbohydrate-binding DOMON domain-containing protein
MDLRRAEVWRSGAALKIRLTLAQLVREWGAPNGFDHLALTLFFSQPGRSDGASVLPQQQASLPGSEQGLRWQHRLRVGGWANALYGAAGADAANEGTPLSPAAEVEADRRRRTVTLTLPAGSLGPAEALAGLRIHVTTWDHDGGYRPLGPQPGGHTVGGADPAGPKVMDAMTITLPQ